MKIRAKVTLGAMLLSFAYSAYAESLLEGNVDIINTDVMDLMNLDAINGVQMDEQPVETIIQPNNNIEYVPMPNPSKPRQVSLSVQGKDGLKGILHSVASNMKEFFERMSRGKVAITTSVGPITKNLKGPNTLRLVLVPGASSHVPIIGNAISAKHELGHEFGLGHASTRIWGSQSQIKQWAHEKDPFDVMTITPGQISLNAAHIHRVGWFNATEEAYAQDGGEYILRLINDGNRDFDSLKSLYYKVPGTTRELWFSYVRVNSGKNGWQAPRGMPGTAIAIHSMSGGETYLEGLIGLNQETNIRSGLIIEASEPTPKTVRVKVTLDPKWVLESK